MSNNSIQPQVYNYDQLTHETIINSIKLIEYFRMNLIYYQLISGKGLEFDKIKDYVVGDDPRRIDWKIFARSNKLMIRKFKEERQFDIVLCIDVSDSMLLGTTNKTKNEFASIVAGALAFAAVEAKDNVAIVLFSTENLVATDPVGQFFDALQIISDKNNYGGEKAWGKLTTTLLGSFHEDAIIFIISDFIDTNVEKFLPELAASFTKVYGVMVRDPVDLELPDKVGHMYLQDTKASKLYLTNFDQLKAEYKILNKKEIDRTRAIFHEYNSLFFSVSTDQDFAEGFIKALGEEKVEIS